MPYLPGRWILAIVACCAIPTHAIAAFENDAALYAYPQLNTFKNRTVDGKQIHDASFREALWLYERGQTQEFLHKVRIIRERFPTADAGKFANFVLRGVMP